MRSADYRLLDNLADAASRFRDAFTYDPGHSDLDDEQPITITVTLGDWRRLNQALAIQPEAGALEWKAIGYWDAAKFKALWESGQEPEHGALLYRPHTPQGDGS